MLFLKYQYPTVNVVQFDIRFLIFCGLMLLKFINLPIVLVSLNCESELIKSVTVYFILFLWFL